MFAPTRRAPWMLKIGLTVFTAALVASTSYTVLAAVPQVGISPIPLTLVQPAHPQVLLAIGNSESMDGNLSGAIMAGSGMAATPSQLYASSSPQNFVIPAGFTPPINAGSSGSAPYTVACPSPNSGSLCDNSPSRLNVAKGALTSILNTYAGDTDFGLLDYSVNGVGNYTTWVYYMSQSGGFTFSSTNTPAPSSGEYVPNPCYNNTGTDTVSSACSSVALNVGSGLTSMPWMLVQNSSDDPSVNDVLYAGGQPPVFLTYGGHTPSNPFTHYTISDYNAGAISTTYSSCTPHPGCIRQTSTTNAGFIPSSDQVLYAQRGFGYGSSGEASGGGMTGGNILVPMTTAGNNPTASQVQTMITKFTPYLAPETNNSGTSEIKASAGQSPLASILSLANAYFSTVNPPSSNGCTPQRFVVLLTDGLPTQDLSGNNWPPLGTISSAGFNVTASYNSDGSLNITNDQALQDAVTVLGQLNQAGIKTYIVGLGAGVDPSKNPAAAAALTAMAIAGGTKNYLAATTPAAVTSQLQAVLSAIQGQNLSTSSAAVNSTGLKVGAVAYQAQFTTDTNPWQDWTGNLLAYPINPASGTVNTSSPTWQAAPLLDSVAPTNRVIATWNPAGGSSGAGAGVPFEWATTPSSTTISSTQESELMTSSTDALGPARLAYLRGDKSDEQQNGGGFRNRSHILGDIVNSNPLYVGASQGLYGFNSSLQSSYQTFENSTTGRTPVLYVGANDGMLHAFNANTGQEMFAFVPNGVFANLLNLSKPTYNYAHQWFVDGSPNAGDVQFADTSWHTILVSGLNGGGNSVFALDVTKPASITSETALASDVLWEFTDSTLGLTYSRPFIALTNVSSSSSATPFLVFFGSGYDNSDGNDYLYALNAQTGALVSKINLCAAVSGACSTSLPNGLSSVVAVNSGGGAGQPADTIYAGDLQGNLWRINISNPNPANWTVSVLFQARDSSGTPQPITTAPVVSLVPNPQLQGVVVYFGTGQFLGASDLTNTQVQSFYAVYDATPATAIPLSKVYTRSNLVQQTLTDTTTTVCVPTGASGNPPPCTNQSIAVRTVSGNTVNWNNTKGWFMDLGKAVSPADTGERMVTNPELVAGAIVFTTYAPSQSTSCTTGGHSFLMDLNYANGGAFPQPQLDLNGDGQLNGQDQVNGANPVGLGLGNVYATAPTILTTNKGTPHAVKLITLSTGAIKSVSEGQGNSGRQSWWQVQ